MSEHKLDLKSNKILATVASVLLPRFMNIQLFAYVSDSYIYKILYITDALFPVQISGTRLYISTSLFHTDL